MDESIQREYMDGKPAVITLADLVFENEIRLDAGNCPIRMFWVEAPHTDDSSLIEVPDEHLLFLGDATCGTFPDQRKSPELCDKLRLAIQSSSADTCLEGHWTPLSKAETVNDLLADCQ